MTVSEPHASDIATVASWMRNAQRVLFITGAGMSADSGLPTYRGMGGLYNRSDTEEGLPIEALLSGQMMRERPAICWKYIAEIEAACRGAKPNAGHKAIVALEDQVNALTVLTQNVDGLHSRAGSRDVIEIHGNLHQLECTRCRWRQRVDDYSGLSAPPSCPECGALVRPNVVLFGEMLPLGALQRLEDELRRGFDLVFTVGTTSVFPYIAQPVIQARHHRIPTVEINPGQTEVSELVTLRIKERAASFLTALSEFVTR